MQSTAKAGVKMLGASQNVPGSLGFLRASGSTHQTVRHEMDSDEDEVERAISSLSIGSAQRHSPAGGKPKLAQDLGFSVSSASVGQKSANECSVQDVSNMSWEATATPTADQAKTQVVRSDMSDDAGQPETTQPPQTIGIGGSATAVPDLKGSAISAGPDPDNSWDNSSLGDISASARD